MDRSRVADVEEIAGHGIMAEVDGKRVGVGNSRLMERQSVNWLPCELPGTIVHVTIDGFYAGHIVIADQPKPDAKEAIVATEGYGCEKDGHAHRRHRGSGPYAWRMHWDWTSTTRSCCPPTRWHG